MKKKKFYRNFDISTPCSTLRKTKTILRRKNQTNEEYSNSSRKLYFWEEMKYISLSKSNEKRYKEYLLVFTFIKTIT